MPRALMAAVSHNGTFSQAVRSLKPQIMFQAAALTLRDLSGTLAWIREDSLMAGTCFAHSYEKGRNTVLNLVAMLLGTDQSNVSKWI